LDLAHNMIQLAGFVPERDIEIRITGMRPGEKLFEEISLDGENMVPTYHEKIRIFKVPATEPTAVSTWLSQLQLLLARRDVASVHQHLAALVPEYKQSSAKSAQHHAAATAAPETTMGRKLSQSIRQG